MKRKTRIPSAGALVAMALLAAQPVSADNVPRNRQINLVQTYGTHAALRFDPPYQNNLGCTFSGSDRFVVIDWSSDPNNKILYASALSAYLTQKQVGFGIIGCSSLYGGGTPLVYRLDVAE